MNFLIWCAASAFAATWPAGELIPEAASIHATEVGLRYVGGVLPALVPSEPVAIDDVGSAGGVGCFNYAYGLTNAWVDLNVTGASLVPSNGRLDVEINLNAQVNSPTDPFEFSYELFCSDSNCPGWVEPFPVTASLPVQLNVGTGSDGRPKLRATVGEIIVSNELASEDVELGCTIGDVERVLNYFGLSFYELIIGIAEGQLQAQIEAQRPAIEAAIEDALSAAYVNQDVTVGSVPLHIELYPREVSITPEGIVLGTQALASAPAAECITPYDQGGSYYTVGPAPGLADDPPGTQVGLLLSDDFANQALYALWRGGLLCYELSGGDVSAPLPIDTTLLGVIGGDPFKALWPDSAQLRISTAPREAPVASFAGDHDITAQVRGLGLDFYADLDDRPVHAIGIDLAVDADVDLGFDDATGELGVNVALGSDNLTADVVLNEFAPGTDAAIATNLSSLADTLLSTVLGSTLAGLNFSIPASNGVGISDIELSPLGENADWLGIWADVGPVSYPEPAEGTASCGSCNSGGALPPLASGVLVAVVALRRKRRA